jgi:hypothetical protein
MSTIQTPNQSFTINSVSYGTLTVTAIGSSNINNLYSGLIGNIVNSDGNSNITVKIINVPVAGTIICKATLPYEKIGGVDLSTYDDGTIYFEPQLVDTNINSSTNAGTTTLPDNVNIIGNTSITGDLTLGGNVNLPEGSVVVLRNTTIPEKFGAVPFTNVSSVVTAADATAAIQAACNSLASCGGDVLCYGGGYRTDGKIYPPKGVRLIGQGGGGNVGGGLDPALASPIPVSGTVFYSSTYGDLSFIVCSEDNQILNISFDSVHASPTITNGKIIDLSNSTGCIVSNCFIHQAYHGVYCANTDHGQGTVNSLKIDGVHMTNVWGHRCHLADVCGVFVSNCAWFNPAIYTSSNGINMTGGCASVFFSDVSVYNAFWGADLTCLSGTIQLNDIHFNHCEFDRLGSGIFGGGVRCNGWVTNIHMSDCWMATGTQGIRLLGASDFPCGGISISGCSIINNIYAGIDIVGPYVDGVSIIGNDINGNNTSKSEGYGAIKIEDLVTNIRILGNNLANDAAFFHALNNGYQKFGIELFQAVASDYIIIDNNIVSRGNTQGIINNSTGTHNYISPDSNI